MFADRVKKEIYQAYLKSGLDGADGSLLAEVQVTTPRDKTHGDYATNLAMIVCKRIGMKPRDVAQKIVDGLSGNVLFDAVEIAGPGFINLRVSGDALRQVIPEAIEAGDKWGWNNAGQGKKVQVEFVSANPTGPLSVGHGRIAAYGDALAAIMQASGYDVSKEYYVNDVGNQIKNLAASVDSRYLELLGEETTEEIGYQGEYIKEYAAMLHEEHGDALLKMDVEERRKLMAEDTIKKVMEEQAESLELFGVKFDRWFRENELYEQGLVDKTLETLKASGKVYEKEDALWFASSEYEDSQDRVLKKSSGIPTYFLSDIAYHKNKFDRGFDIVIDIWGADHHGYIPRMKSSMEALGLDKDKLEILIIQLVRFKQQGFFARMSKRLGNMVALSDLCREAGTDVTRFFFLMRTRESHLDFDVELANDKSEANPMYYLQYANARICSIIRKAEEEGIGGTKDANLSLLVTAHELGLMKKTSDFPWEMSSSAEAREPHRIITYMTDLAGDFHAFYHGHRVVDKENMELSRARLALCTAVRNVFKSGLAVIGISAPESM